MAMNPPTFASEMEENVEVVGTSIQHGRHYLSHVGLILLGRSNEWIGQQV